MWLWLRHLSDAFFYDNSADDEHYRKLRQKSSSHSAFVVGLVAAVGGFLYGYDTGLINDILEMTYVKQHIPLNKTNFNVHERALITAILLLGTFCGALVAPLMSDTCGRKFTIIVSSAVIFNVGNALQVLATDVALLCAGRGVSGLAVGMLSATVPLYQAETSPRWVRGSIVFTYQWLITWGLLIALALCQGTRKIMSTASYRIPIGLQFLWSSILVVGMMCLPESPRYYVQKNNLQAALASLSKLRRLPDTDADLIEELVEIKANYDYEMSFGKTTYLDCFRLGGGRHKQKLRIITGMGVHTFQQCSGINFIFYYGVNFFLSTGIKNYYLISFLTYLVNVIFTIPGIMFIDTIGRRKLLIYGGISMTVCNFTIAIVGVTVGNKESQSVVSIVFSCCFIACFASTWGGCAWALASDIYGISIRQKAVAITASTNWLVNFTFAYITPYLIDTGEHTAALGNKIFFVWGGCNALGTVFVYFMVYETKGLRLEEVDFMYLNCANSRASTKFKSRAIDYLNLPTGPCDQSTFSAPDNTWALLNVQDKEALNSSSSRADPEDRQNHSGGHSEDRSGESDGSGNGINAETRVHGHSGRHGHSRAHGSSSEPGHGDAVRADYSTGNDYGYTGASGSSGSGDSHPGAAANIQAPELSSSSSGSSVISGNSITDYEKYLQSLQVHTSTKRHPLTSQTSTSLLRMPGSSKVTQSVSVMRRNSSQSLNNTDPYTATGLADNVQPTGNMKIIAAPFLTNPPSDSDSD